ncbi:hypothetical protein JBE27_40785 [Streptomyces albiflaviniger]|nr:hypothetical protein [Streptomyces albiflaviniger]
MGSVVILVVLAFTFAALAALGAPAFACTPDLFPDVMAAAIERRQLPIPDMAMHQ